MPEAASISTGRRPPRAGDLLVAAPSLGEPFTRTVILLLDHDESGSLGVVLNRPLSIRAVDVLPGWAGELGPDHRLYGGGPVAVDSALGMAAVLGDAEPPGFRRVTGPVDVTGRGRVCLGVIDLDADPADLGPRLASLRLLAGYSGWSPGQLADELREGSWAVVDLGDPIADAFEGPKSGADFWAELLRRQSGTLAWWASAPRDASMN